MIKTYKANTNVSINVVLPSKKNLHISFIPLSNGSSTFTTDNEEIMNAIECHYNFGKLFRLHSVQGESKKNAAKAVETPAKKEEKAEDKPADNPTPAEDTTVTDNGDNENADANENGKNNEQNGKNNEQNGEAPTEGAKTETDTDATLKQVTVSDLAAAKDYLADKFGISRTTLRSKKAIVEQAAANGIEFVGLS